MAPYGERRIFETHGCLTVVKASGLALTLLFP